jgi:hypothetical protein
MAYGATAEEAAAKAEALALRVLAESKGSDPLHIRFVRIATVRQGV